MIKTADSTITLFFISSSPLKVLYRIARTVSNAREHILRLWPFNFGQGGQPTPVINTNCAIIKNDVTAVKANSHPKITPKITAKGDCPITNQTYL
jgi:hypothetical protein